MLPAAGCCSNGCLPGRRRQRLLSQRQLALGRCLEPALPGCGSAMGQIDEISLSALGLLMHGLQQLLELRSESV